MAALINYTLYFNPKDFPEKYVIRKFYGEDSTSEYYVFDSIEEVNKHPSVINMYWIPRMQEDEAQIVGVWI
ncbi:MAG: hypothetical protein KAI26_04175 [Nanoarchaeota archaeon]|nr:hypothetical protein [Nanoarchaeota archaeon]